MSIFEFIENYPDELSCRMDFKEKREQCGLVCSKCNESRHYWLSTLYQWKCANCGCRTTLRSGTLMHDSKLPVRTWYLCMGLMTHTKKAISSHEMQRQLGIKRYEPVWAMMHKIRSAMGKRDSKYGLEGLVEFDEAFFPKATPKSVKLKRGKGSQRKKNVAVMAESTPLEDINTGKKSSHCRYFKMQVLETQKSDTVNKCVQESINEKSIVLSDKAKNYVDIANYIEGHVTVLSDKKATNETLKWVHIAISNANRTLLGIYHKIKGANLQNYLNEFCYKLNRRYFGHRLFDRLVVALASSRCKHAD